MKVIAGMGLLFALAAAMTTFMWGCQDLGYLVDQQGALRPAQPQQVAQAQR